MKKLRSLTVFNLLVVILATTPCLTASATPNDRWLFGSTGYARALELQREMKLPLVVYFYTDWCPYCRDLDNDYLTSAPVREYLRGVVKVRINPEHGPAERDIAKQYGVRGYPAFFVISSLSASPRAVHPFRRNARNLTPAEFANACEQAASISTPTTVATRPKLRAQIVEVPRSPTIPKPELPTIDAILDKYIAAIGGREAQKKITSRVSKGRVDVPGVSFGGKLEVYAKAPNKSLTIMDVEPMGLIKQGFDGHTGWNLSQNGLEAASNIDRAALLEADFYRDIKLKGQYTRLKLIDKVKDGFRHVYLVEAVLPGARPEKLYFDVDSGLLVRRDLTLTMSRGPVRAEVYYSDWREIDGVKIPFRMTQSMPTVKFVTTFEEVKHNVPVDDTIFRKP